MGMMFGGAHCSIASLREQPKGDESAMTTLQIWSVIGGAPAIWLSALPEPVSPPACDGAIGRIVVAAMGGPLPLRGRARNVHVARGPSWGSGSA